MKAFFVASLLVVAASASLLEEHAVEFQAFKIIHGKSYPNQVEETKRFSIFRDNLRSIEAHNALYEQGLVSYKQKITKFSDKTKEEFKAYLGLYKKPTLKTIKYARKGVEDKIPDSVDWREKGQVTGVKDQGYCGACWAFTITGSTEAAYYRKSGKLVSFSEQQLIDCTTCINNGCDGGYLDYTLAYVSKYGLQPEESYLYEEADNKTCRYDSSKVVTKTTSFVVMEDDEDAILEAVATVGPVGVAINADYIDNYASGVFHDSRCTEDGINHAVLIVGYGTENGTDYWLAKNSWGVEWGDKGYLKLQRGTNECGLAVDPVYPIID